MEKSKAATRSSKKKIKTTASPADKTVALAALAAVGLTLGNDVVASSRQTVMPDSDAAELVDAKSDRVESSKGKKDHFEQDSVEAAEREPSENGEGIADRGEGGKDAAALPELEPIFLADASSVLGVYSSQPLQFAQASAASSVKTVDPGGAGAAADGAAGTTASLGGLSFETVLGFGAIAVGAIAVGSSGGGGSAAPAPAPTPAPAPAPAPAATSNGLAAKGLLSGSTVFYDFNGDGKFTAGVDAFGTTDAGGKYSIGLTAAQKTKVESGLNDLGKELKLVVNGGTDVASGKAFTGSLSSVASKDMAVEGKINVFTTMKAAGMGDKALTEMLGGRTLDSLSASDFDASGDAIEAVALKLWGLVSDKVAGDADAAEAAMTAVSSILEKLDAAGGDLNALLGQGGSLDAAELESLFGGAIDKAVALYDASVLSGEELTDEQLAAAMDDYAQALGSSLAGFADGDVSAADLAAFNDLQDEANTAADTTSTNLGNTAADVLALADRYNAQIGYNPSGQAVSFILDEANAQLLLDQGVTDPFASIGLDLILQVDGTLLGTVDNPLTLAGLQALGVDGISDGTDSFAPYLRLTEENFTNSASDIDFLASIAAGVGDLATGDLAVYVDGTIYNDNHPVFDSLGVIGIDSSNNADLIFDLADYSSGT